MGDGVVDSPAFSPGFPSYPDVLFFEEKKKIKKKYHPSPDFWYFGHGFGIRIIIAWTLHTSCGVSVFPFV